MKSTSAKKILVADDNAALVQAITLRLRYAGYDVIPVVDGHNALARAVSEGPDLMILDVNMPAANGFALVEHRAHAMPQICTPVIYITGDTSDDTFEKAMDLGAFAVIHKPIHMHNLLEAVANALEKTSLVLSNG